jgi:hypothetical protein
VAAGRGWNFKESEEPRLPAVHCIAWLDLGVVFSQALKDEAKADKK